MRLDGEPFHACVHGLRVNRHDPKNLSCVCLWFWRCEVNLPLCAGSTKFLLGQPNIIQTRPCHGSQQRLLGKWVCVSRNPLFGHREIATLSNHDCF